MDPGTMALVGIGASAAGGAVGALGNLFGGESQAKMFQYQAGVARINKQIATQNADYERKVGEVEAQTSGMATRYKEGQIKVAQGASGLDVNSGSAEEVRESEHEVGFQDQAIIRSNAARRAYGYEVEAAKDESQAGVYDIASSQAKTAGVLGAAGSILSGVSSVASKWTQYSSSFGSGRNPTSPGPYEAPVSVG